VTAPLYLVEPHTAPEWAPFAGVRPISELRAGIWSVRERWEAAVDSATTEILGSNIAHFREGNEPRCRAMHPIDGPAIVGASWFAPTGAPVEIGPDTRRLTAGNTTVGWVVPSGERWAGPNEDGQATPIEGMVLTRHLRSAHRTRTIAGAGLRRIRGTGSRSPSRRLHRDWERPTWS
jgi:hypothetical protein